jgi:hypothetical protein
MSEIGMRAALSVAVSLMLVGQANARFLQTDPVGYKDDLDLYAYVGDDPVNRTDPTGMTCSGAGQQTVCQVDLVVDRKGNERLATAADQKVYARFDKSYTAAVRGLLAHPGRATTITFKDANGRTISFKMTSGDLAKGLASRWMAADPHNVYQSGNSAGVTPETGHPETYAGTGMLNGSTSFQRMAIGHEGIHYSAAEKAATSPYLGPNDTNNLAHQAPYNNASEYLQGMTNTLP